MLNLNFFSGKVVHFSIAFVNLLLFLLFFLMRLGLYFDFLIFPFKPSLLSFLFKQLFRHAQLAALKDLSPIKIITTFEILLFFVRKFLHLRLNMSEFVQLVVNFISEMSGRV